MRNHFIEERKKNTFIPELSLVAVLENGMIAGEAACSETDIVTANGRITQLTLLQSAVLPEYRRQGFMVCILTAGVLDGVTGTTYYYGG